MLRRLQVLGLIGLLALGACTPKQGDGGAPYPPGQVPAYLKSSESAARWAEARYYEWLAEQQRRLP